MVKNRQNQAIWSLGDEIFEILGGFCGVRNFDDFWIGEKSVENREFCGKLRFGALRTGDLGWVGDRGGALGRLEYCGIMSSI